MSQSNNENDRTSTISHIAESGDTVDEIGAADELPPLLDETSLDLGQDFGNESAAEVNAQEPSNSEGDTDSDAHIFESMENIIPDNMADWTTEPELFHGMLDDLLEAEDD